MAEVHTTLVLVESMIVTSYEKEPDEAPQLTVALVPKVKKVSAVVSDPPVIPVIENAPGGVLSTVNEKGLARTEFPAASNAVILIKYVVPSVSVQLLKERLVLEVD